MIDENYHIEDIDDMDDIADSSSIENEDKKDKSTIKTKVIYENSDTSRENNSGNEAEYQNFFYDEDEQSYYNTSTENKEEYKSNEEFSGIKNTGKRKWIEEWIIEFHDRRPNTLKATIVGLVLALLILLIGFLKTLLIFVVVLVANLIGQLLDSNPRLIYIINLVRQKFR